jgi:hypothetical protein
MNDKTNGQFPERVVAEIQAHAFASLPPTMAARTHLSVIQRVLPAGQVLQLVDRVIEVPEESIAVFVDEMPGANFGHPCRYRFHSARDGRFLKEEEAFFPPEVALPNVDLDEYHAPLAKEFLRPKVYRAIEWDRVRPWPWLVDDDNRFALLFTSQISNRRHIEDLEFGWRILVNRLGFPADHVYVLCYDGTIGSTDYSGSAMSTWVGDGTPYQMQVADSATSQHLQDTLTTISQRMNSDSLLFIHTNNHGSQTGLCVDNSSVITPTQWGTMLAGMDPFGTLVVTMEQCYSGAFSQPTLDNSRATRTSFASAVPANKVSAGAAHFDPWAQIWFESLNGSTAYGASLPGAPDANSNGRISVREAFNYSDTYDMASYDDPQYADSPQGCGSNIYLTRAPRLSDILRELATKYVEIDRVIHHGPPIPDPGPDWAAELLPSLVIADAVSEQIQALSNQTPKGERREEEEVGGIRR